MSTKRRASDSDSRRLTKRKKDGDDDDNKSEHEEEKERSVKNKLVARTSGLHISEFGDEIQALVLHCLTHLECEKIATHPSAVLALPCAARFQDWCWRELKGGLDARRVFNIREDAAFLRQDKCLGGHTAPSSVDDIQRFATREECDAFEQEEADYYSYLDDARHSPYAASGTIHMLAARALIVPLWRGMTAYFRDMALFEQRSKEAADVRARGAPHIPRHPYIHRYRYRRACGGDTLDISFTTGRNEFVVRTDSLDAPTIAELFCEDQAHRARFETYIHSFLAGKPYISSWLRNKAPKEVLRSAELLRGTPRGWHVPLPLERISTFIKDGDDYDDSDGQQHRLLCSDPAQDKQQYKEKNGRRMTKQCFRECAYLLAEKLPGGGPALLDGLLFDTKGGDPAIRSSLLGHLADKGVVPRLSIWWDHQEDTMAATASKSEEKGKKKYKKEGLPRKLSMKLWWNLILDGVPQLDLFSAIVDFIMSHGASAYLQTFLLYEATMPFQVPPALLPPPQDSTLESADTRKTRLACERDIANYIKELTPEFDYRYRPLSSFSRGLQSFHQHGWSWRHSQC